ncbi:MAG: FUSC family protein [Enterobacteriaceae bacterium]
MRRLCIYQLTGLNHGYWILLTSLFVCQPNYNATRHRLALRIIGTLIGVAIGLPVLLLVPSVEGQLLLIVLTGVLFFAFRNVQYAHATMFITLLVLLCFNLLGKVLKSPYRVYLIR